MPTTTRPTPTDVPPTRRHRRVVTALALAVVLGLVAAACGSDDDGGSSGTDSSTTTAAETAEPTDFSQRGPYAVGELDLELDAEHRLAVFYPVDADAVPEEGIPYRYSAVELFGEDLGALLPGAFRDEQVVDDTWVEAPASPSGPFPVVLYSHGAGGYFRFSGRHNAHLASWGYVVVSVDHPERGLLASFGPRQDAGPDADVIQLLGGLALVADENTTPGAILEGVVDTERVIAEGHSAGGRASGAAAYEDRIDGWIGQAPVPPVRARTLPPGADRFQDFDFATWAATNEPPPVPSMIVAADGDQAVTLDEVQPLFDWLAPPKRLVVLDNAGHNAFTDICAPIQEEGGLAAAVEALGLDPDEIDIVRLGEDGCLADNAPATEMWKVIDHVTVAQVRWVFGQDREQAAASLEQDWVQEQFPGLVESITFVDG